MSSEEVRRADRQDGERWDVSRQSRRAKEILELRREDAGLRGRLEMEAIIDIQERASRILGVPMVP